MPDLMRLLLPLCAAFLAAWATVLPAHGQGNSAALGTPSTVTTRDPCRADVAEFERTIGLLRELQGKDAAAKLKEQLLPAKLEMEILMKDGYCGLSRYLRSKRLVGAGAPKLAP